MDILRELTSQRQVRDLKGRAGDETSLTSVLARASICFGTAHCSPRFCGCWICQMLFFFLPERCYLLQLLTRCLHPLLIGFEPKSRALKASFAWHLRSFLQNTAWPGTGSNLTHEQISVPLLCFQHLHWVSGKAPWASHMSAHRHCLDSSTAQQTIAKS